MYEATEKLKSGLLNFFFLCEKAEWNSLFINLYLCWLCCSFDAIGIHVTDINSDSTIDIENMHPK